MVLVTLLWSVACSSSTAQNARRLSLEEAIRLAQTASPPAQGAAARLAGASGRLRSAGSLASPLLAVSPHVGDNTGGLDEDIVLSQTIELGDKRRQRVYSARAERDAAQAQSVQTGLDLAYSARAAYYEALLADVEKQQASDALNNAQAFANAAAIQFQAGDVARSNVVRSRIEVARARQSLAAAETERANRYDALRSQVGLPDAGELVLTDKLASAPAAYRLPDLLAQALRQRPDLISARKLKDARQADLHAARAATQPDLILEGRRRTLSPVKEGTSLRFVFQFPLYDYGRNRADAFVAQTALWEQEAVYNETLRTAQLDVRTAFRNLEQARSDLAAFEGGRLESAKELLDMAQTGYQKGANSYLELLDAQQVYRSEQVEYARALAAYNTAQAALQRAVGGKLP